MQLRTLAPKFGAYYTESIFTPKARTELKQQEYYATETLKDKYAATDTDQIVIHVAEIVSSVPDNDTVLVLGEKRGPKGTKLVNSNKALVTITNSPIEQKHQRGGDLTADEQNSRQVTLKVPYNVLHSTEVYRLLSGIAEQMQDKTLKIQELADVVGSYGISLKTKG